MFLYRMNVMVPCCIALLGIGVTFLAAAGEPAVEPGEPGTKDQLLFDGKSLDGWKKTDFAGSGEVRVENGQLILGFGEMLTGVTYQRAIPKTNYEIRLEAQRVDGSDFFCGLTFPVGDAFCSFIVGGWGGGVVGLSCLDGLDASMNPTTNFDMFENGRWYPIRLRVTDAKIEAWIGDKQYVDVDREKTEFSVRIEVDASKPFGIAAYQSTAAIRNFRLRPIATNKQEPTDPKQKKRPNLVFLFPDQWRGQALGFLGQEPVQTPNLDRLASQALVFTEAASNYPVCSPYRAMLMTGQYPHTNGVLSNCNSRGAEFGYALRQDARCWSDVLADQGYQLGYIGKWHLESPHQPYVASANNSDQFAWNEWTPPDRRHGFQFWYAYNTLDTHLTPEYWSTDMARDERARIQQWGPEHETDMAIRYLENEAGCYRDASQPFALVVAMNPPHMPYRAVPQHYVDLYAGSTADALLGDRPDLWPADSQWGKRTRANIKYQYAMMTGVDTQVGRILQALDETQLTENTIVVFTSDHGDCLGLHGQISKNNHYELSMRVPLFIRWPGQIAPRQDDLLVSVPDLYPTLLDLMGLADKIPESVMGTSYAPLIRGQVMARPTSQLYGRVPYGEPALGQRGVRTLRYTLMIEKVPEKPDRVVLHDRIEDPYQMHNLAAERPDLVRQLVDQELDPWLEKVSDPWLDSARPDTD